MAGTDCLRSEAWTPLLLPRLIPLLETADCVTPSSGDGGIDRLIKGTLPRVLIITAGSGATEEAAIGSNPSLIDPVDSEVEDAQLGAFETTVVFESKKPTEVESQSGVSFLKIDSNSDADMDDAGFGPTDDVIDWVWDTMVVDENISGRFLLEM